ncbi:MAG: SoxR reducing system RseC family protein [Pseudomonadota bacterium]
MDRLWQPAVVVGSSAGRVRLQFDRISQCERCLRGEGCGAGVFSQLFSPRSSNIELSTDRDWAVGQRVRVCVPAEALATGALSLYGWPLAGFLAGAILGHALAPESGSMDLFALLTGGLFAGGAALLAWRRRTDRWNPEIEALSCDSSPDDA